MAMSRNVVKNAQINLDIKKVIYGVMDLVDALPGGATTSSAAELNALTGVTATPAQFNIASVPASGAEVVTATNVIEATESGKTFFLNSTTEFISTLPAPAAGLKFTFIVSGAPSGASYTVVTTAAAQVIVGHVLTSQDAGGSGDTETTLGATTITFVDGASVMGDRVDVVSDGTNWYASARCAVVAGITLTG